MNVKNPTGEFIESFFKRNFIFVPFVLLAALLEMYALLFTDNGILIHAPWFSLALLAVIVSLTAMVRSYAWRVAILTFVLVAILSVDAGFILLFDINGTAFDYSLLYQAADGLGMMEGQLVNFGFLVPGAIAVAGFLLYGVFNAVKLKDVKIEKIRASASCAVRSRAFCSCPRSRCPTCSIS